MDHVLEQTVTNKLLLPFDGGEKVNNNKRSKDFFFNYTVSAATI